MRKKLLFLSIAFTIAFTIFSYIVARERFQQIDFDTTVKLQDRIPRRFDEVFSYFSLLGSAEITVGLCILMMGWELIHKRILAIFGWSLIVPATAAEVFGKLVVFHPGPPVFLHRSVLPTSLPSFYVHTNFSYPSGHMTRTIFIITVFMCMIIFSSRVSFPRIFIFCAILLIAFLMALTRVYLGEHWLSDVLGGSLLGAASGLFASILIVRQDHHQL